MVNEKKLLEKVISIEAAFVVLANEFKEVKKELGNASPTPQKAATAEWLQRAMMKRQTARIKSSNRRQS